MTFDMWHMPRDRWGEVNILSKFQLPSYYVLGVKVKEFESEDIFIKDDWRS